MKDIIRMFRTWASRRYPVTPWLSIGALILVILYIIDPIDLVPDYIPLVGVIDDGAMLGVLYAALSRDVKKFLAWEQEQVKTVQAPPQLPPTY